MREKELLRTLVKNILNLTLLSEVLSVSTSSTRATIHFVGDRIPAPGNDHTLAHALRQHPNGAAYEVETWEDTAELLKTEAFA